MTAMETLQCGVRPGPRRALTGISSFKDRLTVMSSVSSSPSSTSIGSDSRASLSELESEPESECSEPQSDFTDTRKLCTAAMVENDRDSDRGLVVSSAGGLGRASACASASASAVTSNGGRSPPGCRQRCAALVRPLDVSVEWCDVLGAVIHIGNELIPFNWLNSPNVWSVI